MRCGIHLVRVPWARPGSGFTLLLEAFAIRLVQAMPVLAAARLLGIHDTRLWRMVNEYVEMGRSKEDHSETKRVGIDETSAALWPRLRFPVRRSGSPEGGVCRRRQRCGDGRGLRRGSESAWRRSRRIAEVSIDMSKAFDKGVTEQLPNAEITFDKFHAVSLVNEAVDEVRRQERKTHPEFARYTLCLAEERGQPH